MSAAVLGARDIVLRKVGHGLYNSVPVTFLSALHCQSPKIRIARLLDNDQCILPKLNLELMCKMKIEVEY